ncbi:D-alanyl-D-alanine carboxypeptidase [Metabacillus idriensis]|uniref:D-alanyl-D-alanine carboxypeptidase family protein n=1 Tax=Metabacillus idriensis TaxID=324768 RepID=UPI0020411661|nr:D-alanyl-D-alanine carboxypeptidase family protein [Metabacillus idriensis]MCM3597615.1 D-alanyl-D-alanine carboxypeptidase [Metabacillus idriensis]
MIKASLILTGCMFLSALFSFKAFAEELPLKEPDIKSESAVLIDAASGQILYSKDSDAVMYPASVTKMATAIYAIENGNMEDIVTVSKNARSVDGTRVYLEEGEQVPMKKLIQGLMINSGNDAGVAIAEHISGDTETFSADMTAFLKSKAGLRNTNFTNPHGLFDPEHVTTAEDLAKLTQYASKNDIFREIFSTEELKWDGETWDTTLHNHHKLLKVTPYEGMIGGKNGYVSQSGFTLSTLAERENISLIAIVLNAKTDRMSYKDTVKLMDFGFNHFTSEFISEGTAFKDQSGQKFTLNEPLYYAKKINESISTDVDLDGLLAVEGEDGRELATHKLKPETADAGNVMKQAVPDVKPSLGQSMLHDHLKFIVMASFAVVLLLVGYFFRQVRRS